MRALRPTLAVIVAASLAGCALKSPPEHAELAKESLPNLKVPDGWAAQSGPPDAVGDRWLAGFNDPQLDALVKEALAYNPDLRVAAARVEQAAGYVSVAGATLYPQVNLLARGGGKMSGDSTGLQGVGVFTPAYVTDFIDKVLFS
jgi:outer membrane protein TolC